MADLIDLGNLYEQIRSKIADKTYKEIELPQAFKSQLPNIGDRSIEYHKYTAIACKKNADSIIIPNYWFYLAKVILPYNIELHRYYDQITAVNLFTPDRLNSIRTNGLTDTEKDKVFSLFESSKDAENICKFITDYKWWHGGKDLGRGQKDYYVSAVLSVSGLINDSSTFLANICEELRLKPKLSELLDDSGINTGVSHELYKRQQIFYGAPGTGKSFDIKEQTKDKDVIRTTFHPDSDYSTFVGAYKPIMEETDVRVVPVVLKNGASFDQNNGTYKEKRITYKFVKQAFLKAYLSAWKKYADSKCNNNPQLSKSFIIPTGFYTITSVEPNCIVLSRKFEFPKKFILIEWPNLWKSGSFVLPSGAQSGRSLEHAIAKWIYDHLEHCTVNSIEDGWNKLMSGIEALGFVDVAKKTQTYKLSKIDGKDDCLCVSVEKCRKYRNTLQEIFEGKESSRKLDNQLVTILKQYDETSFDRAWEGLMDDQDFVEKSYKISAPDDNLAPQYLVIEEINRGNCAQIFGDLFQLLDRGDNGFSVYPIEADSDLRDAIKEAFAKEYEYMLSSDIDIDDVIDYTSNYDSTLSADVQSGRVLLLPPNLYIWATMNTSDQSLFPIDSAFKRRWDWVYKPIGYKNDNWEIEIGEKKYKWVDFQKEINQRIFDIDNSEDKQLGDYFVNADHTNNIISANTLLNKILFYLWNDVCKDDPDHIFRWKDTDEKEKSIKFSEFFCEKEECERKLQGFMSFLKVKYIGESESTAEPKAVEISKEENEEVNA